MENNSVSQIQLKNVKIEKSTLVNQTIVNIKGDQKMNVTIQNMKMESTKVY